MAWQSSTINPATTTPAADISKINNDLQQLRGVIGGTPDVAIPSVWTTPANVLAQTANSATTAGTSTAYTLVPAQAITSYAAGQTFWVTFHTASGANPTLQVSGVASPPTLVRQAADGTYVNIVAGDIPANHRSRVTLLSASQALIEDLPPVFASGLLRNLLLNPSGGAVYQRNVAATADDVYFADRWYALTELGNVTPSVLTDPEPGYPFGTRLTQSNATAQRFGFAQIIEGRNCKHLRGWSGVLGARVRASGSQTIRYTALGWTGTEDTVTSDIVNNWSSASFTAGGFFISANLSVLAVGSQAVTANTWTSLPDIFASMGTSFNNVIVMVWTESAQAQNFTLDWDWVQFERGSVLTPPDWRGTAELALCQRYYEQSYEPGAVGTATSVGALQNYNASGATNTAALQVIFKVQKRATPTVTSYSTQSGASGQIRDGSGADRTATVQYVSTSGAHITNSAAGNVANYSAQWVAAIEL